MKVHNFSPGPAILPAEVFEQSAQAILNFNGKGLSLLEISHRSKDFEAVMVETESLLRELIGLPESYAVLFVGGGASTQFYQVPMNLVNDEDIAAYCNTGTWADKAIKEAKHFCQVQVSCSSKEDNYTHIPRELTLSQEAKYLHITTNNTVYGTQYHFLPETNGIPLVGDLSSDFLSRPIDWERFDLIYAGAQKNLGPAGVTVVMVKKEVLGRVSRHLPSMIDYRVHIKDGSMYNTPPVFPIFASMLTLRWIKKMGGLTAMESRNREKAALLYAEIDRNAMFKGTVAAEDRSWMNANFVLENPERENDFLALCKTANIDGIKGHRSVGGFRASMYNAMDIESVQALVEVMQAFEKQG